VRPATSNSKAENIMAEGNHGGKLLASWQSGRRVRGRVWVQDIPFKGTLPVAGMDMVVKVLILVSKIFGMVKCPKDSVTLKNIVVYL
jgi:hypothetical protein